MQDWVQSQAHALCMHSSRHLCKMLTVASTWPIAHVPCHSYSLHVMLVLLGNLTQSTWLGSPWEGSHAVADSRHVVLPTRLAVLSVVFVLQLPDGTKVHILCHSMGNHVLCQALRYMFPSTEDAPGEATYDAAKRLFDLTRSIIFAAPDINRSETNGMQHLLNLLHHALWVPRSSSSGTRVDRPAGGASTGDASLVMYCSKNDAALKASSDIFARRGDSLGRAGYYCEGSGEHHHYHPFMEPLKYKEKPVPHPLKTVDASGGCTTCSEPSVQMHALHAFRRGANESDTAAYMCGC